MSQVRPIEDLFAELIELKSPAEREAYLAERCGDHEGLRGQLEKLLVAYEKVGSFLAPSGEVAPTVDVGGEDLSGQQIGPYTLREQIGDGGMGIVYVAERRKPYRQKVALKLIKPGMDSKAVLARFDAERQALALMDHPHIAKVLDAGTTDHGRPYFVMELIQGQPITDYCDEQKLTINERLELFATVCQAVQHAHQKGVIHRDIKPNNVLVTEIDGKAVPKAIDFGVAKALSTSLTDRTVYTSFQALIGTPLYMSPEQAKLSGVDVDTRSDVYSLGVLLYELLTGDVPFDRERMKQAALDELCRIIREEDPPSLSVRVSKLGDTATQVSQNRATETAKLIKSLKNELTWIVGKAMEKERNRRYQTPSALADDVRAHLADAPITAGKPAALRRTMRWAARHQGPIVAISMVLVALAVGLGVSLVSLRQTKQLADELRGEYVRQALTEVLSGDMDRAETAIQKARGFEVDEDTIATLKSLRFFYGGEPRLAADCVEPLLEKDPDHVTALCIKIMATLDSDQPAEFYRYQAMLRTPVRPPQEDVVGNLLLAQVALYRDPTFSNEITADLIEQYPHWPAVRALHGATAIQLAIEMPDYWEMIERFDEALEDLEAAAQLVPENEFVMTELLVGLTYAIELGQHVDDERTERWRQAVDRLIRESTDRGWDGRRFGSFRAYYLATLGGGNVETQREQLLQRDNSVRALLMMGLRYYGDGDTDHFEEIVKRNRNFDEARLIHAFAEIEESEHPKEVARDVCDQYFAQDREVSLEWHLLAVQLHLFAGDDEAAQRYARDVLAQEPVYADHWALRSMKYLADPSSDQEQRMIELIGPFSVPQTYVGFCIGMRAFANGDLQKASNHLGRVIASGKLDWFNYCIADAVLRRMNAPEWPGWIERTSEPSRIEARVGF